MKAADAGTASSSPTRLPGTPSKILIPVAVGARRSSSHMSSSVGKPLPHCLKDERVVVEAVSTRLPGSEIDSGPQRSPARSEAAAG
jgi:hypothetical protein